MNKRFFLTLFAYFVATMATAFPWHMILFHEKYVAMGAFTRGQPIMPLGMLAIILQAIVFAYFFPIYYRHVGGGNPIALGIRFSLILGILVWTVMVFATAAKFTIEPVSDFILLGTAFQLLQFVAVGIAIGLTHRSAIKAID